MNLLRQICFGWLAVVSLCGMVARAQEVLAPVLRGVVVDRSGAAVAGAAVELVFVSSGARRAAVTGPDGGFAYVGLTAGEYRLRVEARGFAVVERVVSYAGAPLRVELEMGAQASAEVTVSASDEVVDPAEQAAGAHVRIAPEEIERLATSSVSAPFSSLITMTTPGVSADSNGSFHPLGDHAEASFYLDGQPITDQQSRTFSTQVPLNTVQSVEVREGAPGAGVGDKTSMVIAVETRSGLDRRRPAGTVVVSRGGFGTTNTSATVGMGSARLGSFTAGSTVNSDRFLDVPEVEALHARGRAENLFERVDYRWTERTMVQLNVGGSHSWFETPNTYDQQALGQDQRQTIVSYNVAPVVTHVFSERAFSRTNVWLRQDKVRYRPSAEIFADSPAYLEQARRLTSVGLRTEMTATRGRHQAMAGAEYKHTLLAEEFATGLTDAGYNSPCLGADGAPSRETVVRDPGQCAAAGLEANAEFLPGLLGLDLTRGGAIYRFRGRTDIKQLALFAQDVVRFGELQVKLGLRYDRYNGMTRSDGVQPRVGLTYGVARLRTVLRGDYSRVFLTPYNENLIVASSEGPGSPSTALGAGRSHVLGTARRNQYNVGFTTELKRLSITGEYLWKYTEGAYDFDVLLNSPLTFPTQFSRSKIDGGLVRVALRPTAGFAGFVTVSHTRSRLFGPQTGGVSFSAPYSDVVRPDHDEGLAMNVNARYQWGRRGPWVNASYRYDGGLVSVATPDAATVLQLTGDEQQQMGLHCGGVFATLRAPLRECAEGVRATRLRIPAPGTYDADRNPSRIAVRNTVDLSVGEDHLFTHERQSVGVRVDVVNLNNTTALYNYLSTFSGTHFMTPRMVTVALRYSF